MRLPKAVIGRDRDIVLLRAEGWTLRMIANQLGISHESVRKSLKASFKEGVSQCPKCKQAFMLHSREAGLPCLRCRHIESERLRAEKEKAERRYPWGRPSVVVFGCLVCGEEMSKNQARAHLCWGKGAEGGAGKINRKYVLTRKTE